jgi:2-keto-4-pentenoate hydratase
MGWTMSPLSLSGSLSLDRAYAIQRQLTAMRVAEGERVVGWKLGYTSTAMREQMGIAAPNFAPLTDAMLLSDGADLGALAIQPRVEPEIAVRLGRDLAGDVDVEGVGAAVAEVRACLEIVDSIFTDYVFSLEDNTADGSSAAFVVLGETLQLRDRLDEVTVRLVRNGEPVAVATGAAAGGHPLAGVAWLAAQLAERGEALERGQLVITGGLTRAVPLMPGDSVSACFQERTTVSVRRS